MQCKMNFDRNRYNPTIREGRKKVYVYEKLKYETGR